MITPLLRTVWTSTSFYMTMRRVVLSIALLFLYQRFNTLLVSASTVVIVDSTNETDVGTTSTLSPKRDEEVEEISGPPEAVVLYPGEYLGKGEYRYSTSGNYRTGLSMDGDFVLEFLKNTTASGEKQPIDVVWAAGIKSENVFRDLTNLDIRCSLQVDGNLAILDWDRKEVLWSTKTYGYPESKLVVDDGGQIAIRSGSNRLWFGGIPRMNIQGRQAPVNLTFPVRATFYYPW
jgi:hypothetical protein